MKRLVLRLLAILPVLLAAPSAVAFEVGLPTIIGTGGLDARESAELESAVREELAAAFPSTQWRLQPRQALDLLMESKRLDPVACAEESCFSEMGRILGLDILVIGYFRRSTEEDRLLLKLYDMGSGKMEGFVRVAGTGNGALRSSLPDACDRLLHPYFDWEAPKSAPSAQSESPEAEPEQRADSVRTLVPSSRSVEPIAHDRRRSRAAYRPFQPGWSLGMNIATYSGPNHAELMSHINNSMGVMEGGAPTSPFQSFEVGTPLGGRLLRHFRGPISFAASYSFSQFKQHGYFLPHGWESDRTLTSNLHELGLGIHYALAFVNSRTVEPFIGAAAALLLADSRLDITLVNVSHASDGNGGEAYPDRFFHIKSTDYSIGAEAYLGLNYRLNSKLIVQGELGGTMGQINQHFDYSGSLQHIDPGSAQDAVEDPRVNDILWGAYPFDLNGLRLSIGLLLTL